MLKPVLVAFTSLTIASPALAHPGHGVPGEGYSLLHYLTEPVHVASGLAALVLAIATTSFLRRRARSAARRR